MRAYPPKQRTDADRKQEAILFVFQAADHAVLAVTAEQLCARHGVNGRDARREVEARLLARQDTLRRRATQ